MLTIEDEVRYVKKVVSWFPNAKIPRDDLVQEAYIGLMKAKESLGARGIAVTKENLPWIKPWVKGAIVELLRSKKRRAAICEFGEYTEGAHGSAQYAPDVILQKDWSEIRSLLFIKMLQLTEKQQEAIKLVYFGADEPNMKEIAATLGISRDALYDRLDKAYAHLKRILHVDSFATMDPTA